MKRFFAASGLVLSLAACGSDNSSSVAPVVCGNITCGLHEVCDKPSRILDFAGVTLQSMLTPWKP